MTTTPPLRVLFFDVFGTCVAQRTPVADELSKAAKEGLESDVSLMSNDSYEQWYELGGEVHREVDRFASDSKVNHNSVDWRAVDRYRLESLRNLLAQRGIIIPQGEGSLWDESKLDELAHVWHRLPPWPDTCRGLELLNKRFSTVTLSNTYNGLLESLVAGMPFTQIYSADMFGSFKPNPKVYLGAAEKMGVKPEECALVAAHLGDLKGAKACGFYTIYVERPMEEKNPGLREEGIPDLVIRADEEGFVALAERLGIREH